MKLSTLDSATSPSVRNFGFTKRNSLSSQDRDRFSSLKRLDLDKMEALKSMNLEPQSAPITSSCQQFTAEERDCETGQDVRHLVQLLDEEKDLKSVRCRLTSMMTELTPKQKVLSSSSFRPLDLSHVRSVEEKLDDNLCTPMRQVNYYARDCTKIRWYLFTGGEIATKDREFLTQNKIHYIIELSHKRPNRSYCDNSFEYHHFLLRDQENEELMAVSYQVEAIVDKAVKNNLAVLVHCQLGISRSIAVVAACLMLREGRSFDSVYDEICRLRPISAPNAGFMDNLTHLEERLRKGCRELRIYKFWAQGDIIHAELVPYNSLLSNEWTESFAVDAIYLLQFPLSDGVYVWIGQDAKFSIFEAAMTCAKRLVKYEIYLARGLQISSSEHDKELVGLFLEHQGRESDSFLQQWKQAGLSKLILGG